MCKLWLCVVSLFGLIAVVNSVCDSRPTGCQTNHTDYANDTEVYSTVVLNCSFVGSLCCYRQGCVDVGMDRWKANKGYASVRQQSGGCGGNSYSILESPWVNFSTPSCVEFTYHRGTPYQLRVFLAFNNGTQPSLKYDSESADQTKNHTSRFNVTYSTGKIQFRAKGGGANANITLPKLYHVRIIDGSCANLDQATSAPTSEQGRSTEVSSADGGSGKNVAVIVGALVAAVAVVVVFVIIFIVYRRKFQKRRGSGSDGARQLAVYENQGFHGQPVGTPVDDSSVVNARDMSDHRDPSRASDASNEYLTPMNVYDGLGNRNIEENPYNALANQNSTYEGLSPNRNENRLYDSLVASGGQNEDYEIPDPTQREGDRGKPRF